MDFHYRYLFPIENNDWILDGWDRGVISDPPSHLKASLNRNPFSEFDHIQIPGMTYAQGIILKILGFHSPRFEMADSIGKGLPLKLDGIWYGQYDRITLDEYQLDRLIWLPIPDFANGDEFIINNLKLTYALGDLIN